MYLIIVEIEIKIDIERFESENHFPKQLIHLTRFQKLSFLHHYLPVTEFVFIMN